MAQATDLNQFRDMLGRAGVTHDRIEDDEGPAVVLGEKDDARWVHEDTDNVDCYSGFYAIFHFDEAGNLKKVGIWE